MVVKRGDDYERLKRPRIYFSSLYAFITQKSSTEAIVAQFLCSMDIFSCQRRSMKEVTETQTLSQKALRFLANVLFNWDYFAYLFIPLLLLETVLNYVIILKVPYTEIDWFAYMEEVEGYLVGERNYEKLRGQTGPLVYPAGFVYLYSWLYKLTDGGIQVEKAQFVFMGLYLATFMLVCLIYRKARFTPPLLLTLLCVSKRVHSIFVLRLFNDPVAMLFVYACILALQHNRFMLGSILFSIGLSIKMNVLLFLPALGVLMLAYVGVARTVLNCFMILAIQILLGLPFLKEYPYQYLGRAFEFTRIFEYQWTVNWKFVQEEVFLSKNFAIGLLLSFISCYLLFIHQKWTRNYGGLLWFLYARFKQPLQTFPNETELPAHAASFMFIGNFIGIVFARSLHYQFFSWYFFSLPYILRSAFYPKHSKRKSWKLLPVVIICIVNQAIIEYCWNLYPATKQSSMLLFAEHLAILLLLYFQSDSLAAIKSKKE